MTKHKIDLNNEGTKLYAFHCTPSFKEKLVALSKYKRMCLANTVRDLIDYEYNKTFGYKELKIKRKKPVDILNQIKQEVEK